MEEVPVGGAKARKVLNWEEFVDYYEPIYHNDPDHVEGGSDLHDCKMSNLDELKRLAIKVLGNELTKEEFAARVWTVHDGITVKDLIDFEEEYEDAGVWTSDAEWIVRVSPGIHFVNRDGYIVTECPLNPIHENAFIYY